MSHIIPIKAFQDNYIWIIHHSTLPQIIVVDPGDAAPVLEYVNQHQLTIAAILITHHHPDHSGGMHTLSQTFQAPIYGPANDGLAGLTHPVTEKNHIKILGFPDFQIFDIPGHTRGHIAFYTDHVVFSGDTLFSGGCGRLFEGTAQEMYASLEKLAQLPDNTKVYCGHEYTVSNLRFAQAVEPDNPHIAQALLAKTALREKDHPTLPSTLAFEKAINPFLRCTVPTVKHSAETYAKCTLSQNWQIFEQLRAWKNQF